MNMYIISAVLLVIAYITAWLDRPLLGLLTMGVALGLAFFKYLDHP